MSVSTPRRAAIAARGAVVVGAGIAFGALTNHMQVAWATAHDAGAGAKATVAKAARVKPKVVTVVRKKHVASDPIIIYRSVPSTGGSGGGYTPPSGGYSSGGGGSSGGGTSVAPAPAPQPASKPAPPSNTSSSS